MLVLSRKRYESVVIPELGITVQVVEIRGDKVRLGFTAARDVQVHRSEVWESIQREGNVLEVEPCKREHTGGENRDGGTVLGGDQRPRRRSA